MWVFVSGETFLWFGPSREYRLDPLKWVHELSAMSLTRVKLYQSRFRGRVHQYKCDPRRVLCFFRRESGYLYNTRPWEYEKTSNDPVKPCRLFSPIEDYFDRTLGLEKEIRFQKRLMRLSNYAQQMVPGGDGRAHCGESIGPACCCASGLSSDDCMSAWLLSCRFRSEQSLPACGKKVCLPLVTCTWGSSGPEGHNWELARTISKSHRGLQLWDHEVKARGHGLKAIRGSSCW